MVDEVIVIARGVNLGEIAALLHDSRDAETYRGRLLGFAKSNLIRLAVEDPSVVQKDWLPYVVRIDQFADERRCNVVHRPPAYFVQVEGQGRFAEISALDRRLFEAINHNDARTVKSLLDLGADPNAWDGWRQRPLTLAAYGGDPKIVRDLIEAGAKVDGRDAAFKTPLAKATYYGSTTIVGILVKHGADSNARDGQGRTALHLAAENPYEPITRFLVDLGVHDIDVEDEHGQTALHCAASRLNFDGIRALARGGANVRLRDAYGATPLDVFGVDDQEA
jgi:hypothetical protein